MYYNKYSDKMVADFSEPAAEFDKKSKWYHPLTKWAVKKNFAYRFDIKTIIESYQLEEIFDDIESCCRHRIKSLMSRNPFSKK